MSKGMCEGPEPGEVGEESEEEEKSDDDDEEEEVEEEGYQIWSREAVRCLIRECWK